MSFHSTDENKTKGVRFQENSLSSLQANAEQIRFNYLRTIQLCSGLLYHSTVPLKSLWQPFRCVFNNFVLILDTVKQIMINHGGSDTLSYLKWILLQDKMKGLWSPRFKQEHYFSATIFGNFKILTNEKQSFSVRICEHSKKKDKNTRII